MRHAALSPRVRYPFRTASYYGGTDILPTVKLTVFIRNPAQPLSDFTRIMEALNYRIRPPSMKNGKPAHALCRFRIPSTGKTFGLLATWARPIGSLPYPRFHLRTKHAKLRQTETALHLDLILDLHVDCLPHCTDPSPDAWSIDEELLRIAEKSNLL